MLRKGLGMTGSPPLSDFPLFTTHCVDEAEHRLSKSLLDLEILNAYNQDQFKLRMNGINLENCSLLFNKYNTETKLRSRYPGDALLITIGYKGATTFNVNHEAVSVSPYHASVVTPHHSVTVDRKPESEIVIIRIPVKALHQQFELVTDQYQQHAIQFPSELDLKNGANAVFKRTVFFILNEIERKEYTEYHPAYVKMFDQMLLSATLSLPHNLNSKLFTEKGRALAPSVVITAEEYIEANLTEAITIAALLTICKCSKSSLFAAFQNSRDYSPMEFVMERRLQRARRELCHKANCKSVSTVAMDSGFTHLGRFSQTYKRRFGESPSESLKNDNSQISNQ